jgi:hypothetical protein
MSNQNHDQTSEEPALLLPATHHRGADCCSEPAHLDPESRPLSARAARNPHLTIEERESAETEAAEWARVCNRC